MADKIELLNNIDTLIKNLEEQDEALLKLSRRLKLLLPEIQELEAKDIERKEQAVDVVKRLRGEE